MTREIRWAFTGWRNRRKAFGAGRSDRTNSDGDALGRVRPMWRASEGNVRRNAGWPATPASSRRAGGRRGAKAAEQPAYGGHQRMVARHELLHREELVQGDVRRMFQARSMQQSADRLLVLDVQVRTDVPDATAGVPQRPTPA
jgi:hypothetical protein